MSGEVIAKVCTHCKTIKPLSEFYGCKAMVDGKNSWCKVCMRKLTSANYHRNKDRVLSQHHSEKRKAEIKEYNKKRYERTKPQQIESALRWRAKNPEKFRQFCKTWEANNIDRVRETKAKWVKNKMATDLKYALRSRLSCAIRNSIRKYKRGAQWEMLTGYTVDDLLARLQATIPEGYTWDDFMSGKLHIDHKIPVHVFNYTKPEHIDFKRCWALDNLQLLPAAVNRAKSDHLDKPFQPALQIAV